MSVRVSLSTVIYPKECLEQAISAYSGFCSVKICMEHLGKQDIEISIKEERAEPLGEHRVTNEFLNYLLDLSLELHLQPT
jgi:hypothetical protein